MRGYVRDMALLIEIFLAFVKVGVFGFGGGPAMIPLIQAEVVDVHHWLSAEEFVDALALGNSLPGPIATKMSAYVGYKLAGIPGSLAGVLGTVGPSAVLMLLVAALFLEYKDQPRVVGAFRAVRPVVVALMLLVVYRIWPQSVVSPSTAIIAAVAFAGVAFLGVHPALAILAAAVFGAFTFR